MARGYCIPTEGGGLQLAQQLSMIQAGTVKIKGIGSINQRLLGFMENCFAIEAERVTRHSKPLREN
jgi:hypothetical protein